MNEALLDKQATDTNHYTARTEGKIGPRSMSSEIIDAVISTEAFLSTLRAAGSTQRLIFQLNRSPLVAPGYHVTEVKSASYQTMDCGGVANNWRETIIQLWNPGDEPTPEHMTVQKFLAIYDRVAKHIPISNDAEVRFEYGDIGQPAYSYHVLDVETRGELIFVDLRAPAVTCKARDRKNVDTDKEVSCCG
jgi:Family of unknown function (DUF6428)